MCILGSYTVEYTVASAQETCSLKNMYSSSSSTWMFSPRVGSKIVGLPLGMVVPNLKVSHCQVRWVFFQCFDHKALALCYFEISSSAHLKPIIFICFSLTHRGYVQYDGNWDFTSWCQAVVGNVKFCDNRWQINGMMWLIDAMNIHNVILSEQQLFN